MKNKLRILVAGGAGFIGSHLVDELLKEGHRVFVLDNLSNGSLVNLEMASKNSKFSFIKASILNKLDCNHYLKGIDVVYHLACLGVRHSIHSPFENHRVNAEGTLNILEASRINKVKKVFYISSSEIYGSVRSFPINEDVAPRPLTVYGASKLVGEHYTNAYRSCFGLDTVILRIFNNFGPRAHYEGDAGELIPRTIVNVLYGRQPVIFGDGSNTRDFLYVLDTAYFLRKLLDIKGLSGLTINIGTGEEIRIKRVVEEILQAMFRKDIKIKFIESRPADVPRLWVNARRFHKLTKLKPRYSFGSGLLRTIEYYSDIMNKRNLLPGLKMRNWEKD
jgi:UDP-glucose 4-epimerase